MIPAETTEARAYSCRVTIQQKADGRIQDVSLDDCEGSFAWLESLKTAIYSASPLPDVPHPAVFVDSFSMIFRSP